MDLEIKQEMSCKHIDMTSTRARELPWRTTVVATNSHRLSRYHTLVLCLSRRHASHPNLSKLELTLPDVKHDSYSRRSSGAKKRMEVRKS